MTKIIITEGTLNITVTDDEGYELGKMQLPAELKPGYGFKMIPTNPRKPHDVKLIEVPAPTGEGSSQEEC